MKVYFVRHGQTKYNVLRVHQPKNAELSELGIKQAKILAKRFSKIPVDIIYSSPMKRAKQTAEIINKSLKKRVIFSNFLKERKGPSEFLRKRTDSLEVFEINQIRNLHENDPFWHYSDEENFREYQIRTKKLFKYLNSLKKENVLVISHGGPIRMAILFMMFNGKDFDAEIYYKFIDLFRLSNTGITMCEKDKTGHWDVRVFNDHAHLG